MGKLDELLAIQKEFKATKDQNLGIKITNTNVESELGESKVNENKNFIRISAEEYARLSTLKEKKSNKKVSNLKIGLAIFGLGTFIVVAGNNWVHSDSYVKFHQEVSNLIDETGDKVIEAYLEKVLNSSPSY